MLSDYYQVSGRAPDWSRVDVFGYPFQTYQFTFSIDGGVAYRQLREEWKHAYQELSRLIRTSRHAFRNRHRRENGTSHWRALWPQIRQFCRMHDLDEPNLEDETLRWELKSHARFLIALRQAVEEHRSSLS